MSPQPAPRRARHLVRPGTVAVAVAAVLLGAATLGEHAAAPEAASQAQAGPPAVTFSSYLGGLEWDEANDVEVDDEGNRHVTGFTLSADFPAEGAEALGPGGIVDAFVAKVLADGTLAWSVVVGGSDLDVGNGIALDDDGNVYVTGRTGSADFPTAAALQPALAGEGCTGVPCHDAFVTKLSPDGALVYSTYLGGSRNEEGLSVAVGDDGSAHVSGNTDSPDLPTVTPFQAEFGSPPCPADLPCPLDVFAAKLTPAGDALAYSTYLGGESSEQAGGLALADDGTSFVTGATTSADFPTEGAVQTSLNGAACGPPPGSPCPDVFLTKLSAAGDDAVYSTLVGGAETETAGGVAVDAQGRAVITGATRSTDFPTAQPAQGQLASTCPEDEPEELCDDGFVARLDPAGGRLEYSTYLGGAAQDQGRGVAVDDAGTAFVTGRTDSRDFPTAQPVQAELGGYIDGFVTALSAADGSVAWSTFVGGSDADRGNAAAVGDDGSVHAVGRTLSPDFPTVAPLQAELRDADYDAFVHTLR